MNLARFARRRYTEGFTPIEAVPRFSNMLDGPNIYIKRDDLLGLSGGGNKTRKLEFLVADALQRGADTFVVEGDGAIVPFIYGFPRRWSLGSIDGKGLSYSVDTWRTKCASPVAKMLNDTLARLSEVNAEYVDLFGELLVTAGSSVGHN